MGTGFGRALWIGAGGFLGANARYWLGVWIQNRLKTSYPWGTFGVNVSGAFLLGLLMAVLSQRLLADRASELQLLLAAGFLGSYTTFSTFAFETLSLAQEFRWGAAMANGLGSLVAGLIAVWLGSQLGRWLG